MLRNAGPVLSAALAAVVALALGWAILELPREPGGLTALVTENLPEAAAVHPVTAVLLDFRAYDTWLEVGVLLLAALAVLALRRITSARELAADRDVGPLLGEVSRIGVPIMILVAGLLLWLGSDAPGGAFQSGAVLAAAGILLLLAGHRSIGALRAPALQLVLAAGFLCFLLVALLTLGLGRALLDYPPDIGGGLIVFIELGVALAVGGGLALLFVVARLR